MNSHRSNKEVRKARRRFRAARGQSYVELALALPVLALILVVAADFGRLFYSSVEVINAARAGAQYGSNSVVTAANTSRDNSPRGPGGSRQYPQPNCDRQSVHVRDCDRICSRLFVELLHQ